MAAVRPYVALLLVAGLGPLSTILFLYAGVGAGGLRLFEAMVLAAAAGWSLHHTVTPTPLRITPPVLGSAAVLIAAALASAVISTGVLLTEEFGAIARGLRAGGVFGMYAVEWSAVQAALLFAEGLILFLAVTDTCGGDQRRRDGLTLMLVAGAAAAALFNVMRIVEVSLAREHPWQQFRHFLVTLRVNVHHSDLNAAGSYFAMMLFLALGTTSRSRIAGIVAAILIATAVWITGSRTALAAAFVTLVGAGLISLPPGRVRRLGAGFAVMLLILGAVVLWTRLPEERHGASTPYLALLIRIAIAKAGLAMAADNPLFGVGLGHFFERSREYAGGPFLNTARGYIVQENAHNNFLQILAELGVPALLLFVGMLAWTFRSAFLDRRPLTYGLTAGLLAYLVSCLGSHPLMVPHAAYPFWMGLGAAAAAAAIDATPRSLHLGRYAVVLVILLAVTLPFRATRALERANVEHTSIGFSGWQRDAEGKPYRWAGGRATFFVASASHSVRIPFRHGMQSPQPIEVRVHLNEREANRIVLEPSAEWREIYLPFTRRSDEPFTRIDLEVRTPGADQPVAVTPTDASGALQVGRPLIKPLE